MFKIIKLNAIDSTNDFLKSYVSQEVPEHLTAVYADIQSKGRGQQGAKWESEPYKNLTCSLFVQPQSLTLDIVKWFNFSVGLALIDLLSNYVKNRLQIKWPNDILADGRKIAGILIENQLVGKQVKHAVIGIGLNVNQLQFEYNQEATSLKALSGRTYDIAKLLSELQHSLDKRLITFAQKKYDLLNKDYFKNLYLYQKVGMYADAYGTVFQGIIRDIDKNGSLVLEKESGEIHHYGIKEIKFLKRL